jgi:hypothetical protein
VGHSPSRLVSDAKLPLKLFSRHAMPGRGEQIHGVEPLLQGRPGGLKGRSNHRVNVPAAPLAGINWLALNLMKFAFFVAVLTNIFFTVFYEHQVRQARIIIGKAFKELSNVYACFHGFSPVRSMAYLTKKTYVCQGDNHVFL